MEYFSGIFYTEKLNFFLDTLDNFKKLLEKNM